MDRSDPRGLFFRFVIPAVLSFALSGVYAIVDGFFVGNSIGDLGLSAINIAYPVVAAVQALGTGIGMGGAIRCAVRRAEKRHQEAGDYLAAAFWTMLLTGLLLTGSIYFLSAPLLTFLGAEGELVSLGRAYLEGIALGAVFQVLGTGLVPFIRNLGGALFATLSMSAGFAANIVLDALFVWILGWGMAGAAWATVIGQAVTMVLALGYLLFRKQFLWRISLPRLGRAAVSLAGIGAAPFGLALSPNLSLLITNRFSLACGGALSVAVYACISYVIYIVYLLLQGVGDGCQPLISLYYGERDLVRLRRTRNLAYGFAFFLSGLSCALIFGIRNSLGSVFGASGTVGREIAGVIPIFLLSVPFVAVLRIATAHLYATEKSGASYILTLLEPLLLLGFMLVLTPGGGQSMVWWSTVFSQALSAALALACCRRADRADFLSRAGSAPPGEKNGALSQSTKRKEPQA